MPAHPEGECLSLGDTEGSTQKRKDRRMKFSVFPLSHIGGWNYCAESVADAQLKNWQRAVNRDVCTHTQLSGSGLPLHGFKQDPYENQKVW